ncbi:MAG TPA: DMT family transporter [Cellvibrionaceae bacterium]
MLIGKRIGVWAAAALGLFSFAGTFPVTRGLINDFTPVQLGSGRVLLAAMMAGIILLWLRPGWPPRASWPYLLLASITVALAFPLLLAIALVDITASGAAVLGAVLPLVTGIAALLIAREQPQRRFWWACSAGSCAVVIFALQSGDWRWSFGNNWLAAGIVCASLGYAAGARAAHLISAWQVACWMVILAAPLNLLLLVIYWPEHSAVAEVGIWQWAGFVYLALFSQLLGFMGWNYALAQGGIARVGQLQLLQPFITLLLAWALLGEIISPLAIVTLLLVIGSIFWARSGAVKENL